MSSRFGFSLSWRGGAHPVVRSTAIAVQSAVEPSLVVGRGLAVLDVRGASVQPNITAPHTVQRKTGHKGNARSHTHFLVQDPLL